MTDNPDLMQPDPDEPDDFGLSGRPCARCGHYREDHVNALDPDNSGACRVPSCVCTQYYSREDLDKIRTARAIALGRISKHETVQLVGNFADVAAFHAKLGYRQHELGPHFLAPAHHAHRVRFLCEELEELLSAETLEHAFDALLDLVYVAMGTAEMMGLPWEEGWRRVHAANMQKEPGVKPGRFGGPDAIKPKGWTAPDLSDLVVSKKEDES